MCMGNHLKLRDILVFVTGILHYFGNNNSYRRMCCSNIGIGIGNGNRFDRDIERYR